MRFIRSLALAAISGMLFASVGFAQNCDALLSTGLANTYSFSDNTRIEDAAALAVCSNRTRNSSSGSGFDVNLPLAEIGSVLGFSATNEITRASVDQFCRSGQSASSRQAAVQFARSVLDPAALAAWSACVANSGGLSCATEPLSAGQFSVTVSWRRQNQGAGTDRAVIQGAPQLSNATCPGSPIQANAAIMDASALTEFCRFQDPAQPASIALNTSQGPVICTAEAAPAPIDVFAVSDRCAGGSTIACLELMQMTREALDRCEGTGSENLTSRERFALEIQCSNARSGLSILMTNTAAVDQACWRQDASCAAALSTLGVGLPSHATMVNGILTGSSDLGSPFTPRGSPILP